MDSTATLTPAEKGRITRQRNEAARRSRRAEWLEAEKKDRALVLDALRRVIADPSSTPEQCLFAVRVLDEMGVYHLIPLAVKNPRDDNKRLFAQFREELKNAQ